MKATVPARQVDYCDICYRETGYLRKCAARGVLHELVLELFTLCGVELEDREHAAQIAKEIAYEQR